MIKNLLFAITLTVTINSFAGDTTNIQVHDHTDMTSNGNYDEWGVFPDGSKTYRKSTCIILLDAQVQDALIGTILQKLKFYIEQVS